MKVLFVTPYFYPKTGGLENYVYNIAKGFIKKHKWEVVVITSNHKSSKDTKEKIEGMKVYRLSPLFKISNTPIHPLWYFKIKKIITSEQPNIINAHAPVPFIADIASRVKGSLPFIVTYHAGSMKKNSFFYDILIGIYENIFLLNLFRKADGIICASEFVKKSLPIVFRKKCVVITPAVDTSIFKPSSNQKKKYDVLFVGRYPNVYRLKGLSYLLKAMKNLPEVTLTVVGKKVPTVIKNVRFLGLKTPIQLAEIMKESKLLILPSIAPMESFGMVLVEAMACKIPVIGTRMGGIPEIISNQKNGIIVPIKNSYALKNAIEKIINNKNLARKMGDAGYRKVQRNYLWSQKVEQTYKVLKTLS